MLAKGPCLAGTLPSRNSPASTRTACAQTRAQRSDYRPFIGSSKRFHSILRLLVHKPPSSPPPFLQTIGQLLGGPNHLPSAICHLPSPPRGLNLPRTSHVPGFGWLRSAIPHSAFCIRPGVALADFSIIFCILHSAFPQCYLVYRFIETGTCYSGFSRAHLPVGGCFQFHRWQSS